MKKALSLILSVLLMVSLLAACGGSSGGGSSTSGTTASGDGAVTVIIGGQSDVRTMDPGHMYEPYGNMFSYASYDMLYRIESGTMGTPEPSVATDYEVSEDGLVYTFTLREDVVFSSGNPLTAHDVVWSFNRVLNMPESNAYVNIKIVEKAEALDDYTVQITLTEQDASFLVMLTANAYCIFDSEVVKEHGGSDNGGDTAQDWLNNNSAGSGPYIIEKWTPKEEIVLAKNENYWGKDAGIDKIIFREMTSVDAQITALKNGDIDIALGLNGETAKQLDGVEGISLSSGTTALITFLVMNRDETISPEMANPKVQEAVRAALDYEGYLALSGEGSIVPLNFVQSGFDGALTRDLEADGQDIEKAKALMAEAGYADGFEITLTCGNNNSEGLEWTTIAEKVKQDLAEIGITVNIETLEATLVYDKMAEASMPFYVMFWSPDFFDINNQLSFLPGTGENGSTYGNRTNWDIDEVNQAVIDAAAKVKVETDPELRAQYAEEMQEAFALDNPFAFILQSPKTFAYNSELLATVTYNDLCKIELCELRVN